MLCKNKHFFGLLLAVMFLQANAQVSELDSLIQRAGEAQEDSTRADLLTEISGLLSSSDSEESMQYAKQADSIAEMAGDPTRQAWAKKAVGLAKYNLGLYVDAVEDWQAALTLFQEAGDQEGESNILNNLGATMNDQGDDAKAMDYFLQSLGIGEEISDPTRIGTALLNIGSVYMKKAHTLPQAITHFERAIPYFEDADYQIGLGVLYLNLGEASLDQGAFDPALKYLQEAREILAPISAGFLAHAYNLLGRTYIQLGDFSGAISIQEQALELAEEQQSKLGMANAYLGLAESHQAIDRSATARSHFEKAETLFIEIGGKEGLSDVYRGLADSYAQSGNFEKAYRYHDLWGSYQDSLYSVAVSDEVRTMRFTYDLTKKEGEIALLNSENQIQQAEIQKAKTTRNFLYALAAFILIILGGIAVQYRLTRESREKQLALDREREVNEQLQHINQLKDQFLANTSHELRTPLNGIIGLADSLQDGAAGVLPEKARHDLGMIGSSGRRLANLVNDILDFSKLRNHDLKLKIQPVDMHSTTNIIFEIVKPLITSKAISLRNDISPTSPLVAADENRIQQILLNLVENGIKFSDDGEISVSSEVSDGFMLISVTDQGIGIKKESIGKIFQSFEQGDAEQGGTGLGLSVTKRLVELHGGEVTVDSVVNEGSTFTITLPLSEIDREEFSQSQKESHAPALSRVLGTSVVSTEKAVKVTSSIDSAQVLVVDDDPVNRQVLENHLTLAAYDVTHASNGEEALKLIREKRFDIVLLDIMMPRMNGFEVCKKLRELYMPNELTVVLLTAKNQLSDLVTGFNVGANDYLTKPFAKDELLSRLNTHVSLHRINQASAKFVPVEFLSVLGHDTITEVHLGDHKEKEVTVFFSDIRSYVTLTELMPPDENFRFVNSYSRRMGPIIGRNHGFISQYLGDGIMAIFPESPQTAIQAAVEMQLNLQQFNIEREKKNRAPLEVGMGIHTGSLIMGIIGDGRRLEHAMVSKNVNITSRIEGLTKQFGTNILFSESTFEKLDDPEALNTRFIGKVQVKGIEAPIKIYECFDGDLPHIAQAKLSTKSVFEDGLNWYLAKNFEKASKAFEYIVKENPDDRVAQFFHNKILDLLNTGIEDDWTGVHLMDIK